MKLFNIDIEFLERIFLWIGILFICFYLVFLFNGCIEFTDEKECYDYYIKTGYKLNSCKRWFK